MALGALILALRVLTLVSLVISMVVLLTTAATLQLNLGKGVELQITIYAYRYMLGTAVVGAAYTLIQIALTLLRMSKGKEPVPGDGGTLFDFFGDKIASFVLATGSAAGLLASKDMKSIFKYSDYSVNEFFDKGYAAAGLLLLAFICTALLSTLSSLALFKRA